MRTQDQVQELQALFRIIVWKEMNKGTSDGARRSLRWQFPNIFHDVSACPHPTQPVDVAAAKLEPHSEGAEAPRIPKKKCGIQKPTHSNKTLYLPQKSIRFRQNTDLSGMKQSWHSRCPLNSRQR